MFEGMVNSLKLAYLVADLQHLILWETKPVLNEYVVEG